MERRQVLLNALESIPEPILWDTDSCVAGFDLHLATSQGTGYACCQCGSREIEGPVRITAADLLRLAEERMARDSVTVGPSEDADEDAEDDQEAEALLKAMAAAKCLPDTDYYYFIPGEDFEPEFHTSHAKAYSEWIGPIADGVEYDSWEDMEDDELEAWVEKLGLTVPGP